MFLGMAFYNKELWLYRKNKGDLDKYLGFDSYD